MLSNWQTTLAKKECNGDKNVEMDCDKTKKEEIRNEGGQKLLGVASIDDKLRERLV